MITQTINLNMVPGSVYPVIHVSQYDNDSGALKFNLFNGSAFSVPAGSAVVINGTKPDGYGFSYSATYSGNVVTANVTQQMTAVAGEVKCELRITKNSDIIGTQNFTLMVEPAALDNNTVISDSDIPAIAAAADYAASASSSASAAATSAADAASTLAQTKRLGGVTAVSNGTDLNTMTSIGEYQFSSNTASTLVHCPITIGGRLTVEAGIGINSSQYIRQTIMRYNRADEIFTRVSVDTGSNWTNWYQFTLTDTGA